MRCVLLNVVVRISSGGSPAPCVLESSNLGCGGHLVSLVAEEHVVLLVRLERRIEVNEINACVRKFFGIPQPAQIVAEVKSIHAGGTVRDVSTSLNMTFLGGRMLEEGTDECRC